MRARIARIVTPTGRSIISSARFSGRQCRLGFPGGSLTLLHIHEVQQHSSDDEETYNGENRSAARAGQRDHLGEERRPEDPRELLHHREKAKELRRLLPRNETGEE